MEKYQYYNMTEQLLKDYRFILNIIDLVDIELEKEDTEYPVEKLKYIKNKHEIIIKKIDIAVNNMSDKEYILFDGLYIANERPMNIMAKADISKSTYYKMKDKLIEKVSEIIYPRFIRNMYEYKS